MQLLEFSHGLISETFEPSCSTCIWNLYVEPLNLDVEPCLIPLCGTFTRNLCVKLLSETFMTNIFAKRLCGTFLWNLGTFVCGTWELVKVEPFIWNLGKPEPLCGTSGLVPGFWPLPQTTPKLYWKNPKLLKLLGKTYISPVQRNCCHTIPT